MRRRPSGPVEVTGDDRRKVELLLELVNERSQPNLNALRMAVRDIPFMALNIKTLGYDLARRLASELPVRTGSEPREVGLRCKPSTQADMQSDWVAHWCAELQTPLIFHRKLWELSYVMQAVYEHGLMRDGVRALGFGCGEEPLASYFAARGVQVTVTDLATEQAIGQGWAETGQHTANLDKAYQSHLLDRASFDRLVTFAEVDMNAIPDSLRDYDFCWSVCALEHLGSIARGLDFIEHSLDTLRSGGVSVHTTEFNIDADGPTVDNWSTVLFQRRHLEDLAKRLRAKGHDVAELDFFPGDMPMDRFIDIPPYSYDLPLTLSQLYGHNVHLKLSIDGFPCTCFGLLVRKA